MHEIFLCSDATQPDTVTGIVILHCTGTWRTARDGNGIGCERWMYISLD